MDGCEKQSRAFVRNGSRVYRLVRSMTSAPYVRLASLGDRIIAASLGTLVAFSSLLGIYALERHFLVAEPAYGGTLDRRRVGSPAS
jgi:hypothetical protein